jgi:K+-transporting ATPase ATPase C chain
MNETPRQQSVEDAIYGGASPAHRRTSLHSHLITAVLMTIALTVLVGILYPFAITGLAQAIFPDQANGSLVRNAHGQVIGSRLIGQDFTQPQYFHPRLSAAGRGYDASASGGTNLGPTNTILLQRTVAQANRVRKENGLPSDAPLPADAVSASASGLDPDISPAYAALQIPRVARVRHLREAVVRALVEKYTSPRAFGILGEPRVNVLQLNLALDRLKK